MGDVTKTCPRPGTILAPLVASVFLKEFMQMYPF